MSEYPDRHPAHKELPDPSPGSPYGPQPRGTDEAAGGADSSPYENEPTGRRKAKADAARRTGRDPGDQVNQAP